MALHRKTLRGRTDSKAGPQFSRGRLVALATATVILGLASRHYPIFGNYPGDALWATLVGFLWAFIVNRASLLTISALTLATSYSVEFSQLYHAPWIDQIRSTLLGRLVLGSGFDPFDLIAYSAGVLLAAAALKHVANKAAKDA